MPTSMRSQGFCHALSVTVLMGLVLSAFPICAQTDFEQPPQLKPQDVLENIPLKTGLYEIDPVVTNNGVVNEFFVHTGLTMFRVIGNDMLSERLRETQVIAALDDIKRSDAYAEGVKTAGKSTIKNLKTLVTNPVGTLSAIPAGIERFFGNAYRTIKRDSKSPYEDSTMKEVIGFSKVKRSIAVGMSVDPYSSNDKLQEALNDVAWASYAGGMSLKVVGTLVVPAPVDTALTATRVGIRMSQQIRDESPENLRKINSDKLKTVGASGRQIDGLLNNNWFSPTRQTILAECLSQMRGVENIADYLDWAADAISEEQAFFIQRSAELLQSYHADKQPLARLYLAGALPVAESKEGTPVLALAFDYLAWTERAHDTAKAIRADLPARLQEAPIVLLTQGRVSPKALDGLKELNYIVQQNERINPVSPKA